MTALNVVITHMDAPAVDQTVRRLQEVAPSARYVVAHGGERSDYDAVGHDDKVFVDDPTLRGPRESFQSYNVVLRAVYDAWVGSDTKVDAVYLFEYDHLILREDFESSLAGVAAATEADFMGKACVDRTGTNWQHYARFRDDPSLLAHLRAISVREDPSRMFGCLGNGFWISRPALKAYVAIEDPPRCYGELYVPTVLHHLGFRVVDIDAASDLYRAVRWTPPFSPDEVERLRISGATFVHPVK